jgi:hypothetical protein
MCSKKSADKGLSVLEGREISSYWVVSKTLYRSQGRAKEQGLYAQKHQAQTSGMDCEVLQRGH